MPVKKPQSQEAVKATPATSPVEKKLSQEQELAVQVIKPEEKVPFWQRDVPFLSGPKKVKFKTKDLIQFYRGVGSMLKAQMNTSDALHYYSKGLPNKKFAEKLQAIRTDIGNGMSTKEAFVRAECFNDMTIGLVQSGSDAGRLDKAFAALANRLTTDQIFQKKLKKVIMIPCIVIPILLGTFIVAQIQVVPQVEGMLSQVKQEPDPISKMAFQFSHLVQDFWPVFVACLVTFILILVFSEPTRQFALNLLMSRWRILRNLIMSLRQMTLLSTICLLHSNGINLARSVRVSANTVKGSSLYKEILEAADRYEQTGIPIAMAFSKYTSIDEQVCHMMAIGERSASIDDNLRLMADMYEEEAENNMEALTHIVNALVLFIAVGLIAAVFISSFLPIFLMGPRLMQNSL